MDLGKPMKGIVLLVLVVVVCFVLFFSLQNCTQNIDGSRGKGN